MNSPTLRKARVYQIKGIPLKKWTAMDLKESMYSKVR